MAKIKLTKGELKRERDSLKRYERYLPILQLKKQQLQMEILREVRAIEEKRLAEAEARKAIGAWAGLLAEPGVEIKSWVRSKRVVTGSKNIAGVDLVVFEGVEFDDTEYDLFLTPLWLDGAIESLRGLIKLLEEIVLIESSIRILRQELRVTTQRVNLFEKVKIPEAEEAIRLIKVYIGDQMANAVGRSKIAKRKIEAAEEALVA